MNSEWELRFTELARFQDQNAHVRVPRRYPPCPELPLWLAAQKTGWGDLSPEQVRRLWDLGVRFPRWDSRWLFQFFKLVDGKARFGDANDPRIWQHDPSLKMWIKVQRTLRGRRLAVHRWRWLNEIGFIWNVADAVWEQRFAEWREYVREFSTSRIPKTGDHQRLGQWAGFQRLLRRKGKLNAERIRRLDEAGFPWNPKADLWEHHFHELERFHRVHGHARVGEVEGRSDLAAWCWDQTRHHKLGEVPPERVARLDALGFTWNPREDFFDRMLAKMKRFHALHGHGRVPEGWQEAPRLAAWIRRLRQARKKGVLSTEKIRQLDGLFEWNPRGN